MEIIKAGDYQKLTFYDSVSIECHSKINMKFNSLQKEILKIRMNSKINNLYYPLAVLYTVSSTSRMAKRDKLQRQSRGNKIHSHGWEGLVLAMNDSSFYVITQSNTGQTDRKVGTESHGS